MKKYSEYKESDVEWIGEIPFDWLKVRLKLISSISKGKKPKKEYEDYSSDLTPYLSMDYLRGKTNQPTYAYNAEKGLVKVNEGDLLILWDGSKAGEIVKAKTGVLSSTMALINIRDNSFDVCYLNYLLQFGQKHIQSNTIGMGIPHVDGSVLRNLIMLKPILTEQTQIAIYLDHKTGIIDALVEKKELLIKKLIKQRQALINEAVTKGLNSNAKMKDSGVEWLGEIPEHWTIRKGSVIGKYSKGKGIKKDEVVESGIPCVRYGEIYTHYNLKVIKTRSFISTEISKTSVKVAYGAILITSSGETKEDIGKCIVNLSDKELYVGGDVVVLTPNENFDPLFLSYLINSESIRFQREISARGDIIVHIYAKNFKTMYFPTPSLSEQSRISVYLEVKNKLIDDSLDNVIDSITQLKNYRQAIISEAVTGKVDVRDIVLS